MSLKVNYITKATNKISSNVVLFSNDDFKIDAIKSNLSSLEFSYIKDLLKTSDLKQNLLVFELTSNKKIIIIFHFFI